MESHTRADLLRKLKELLAEVASDELEAICILDSEARRGSFLASHVRELLLLLGPPLDVLPLLPSRYARLWAVLPDVMQHALRNYAAGKDEIIETYRRHRDGLLSIRAMLVRYGLNTMDFDALIHAIDENGGRET